MPKRNYGYEKRQKELIKQRKQEDKRQRKLDRANAQREDMRPEDVESPEPRPEE